MVWFIKILFGYSSHGKIKYFPFGSLIIFLPGISVFGFLFNKHLLFARSLLDIY